VSTPAAVAPAPATNPPAKLDEVMLAMDVVDTLRHRERLVEKELNEDLREEDLVERLKALYQGQGIEVTDAVIRQGVKALKEQRFVYTPPPPSFGRTLATAWVNRATTGKWLLGTVAAVGIAFGGYQVLVAGPERARIADITTAAPQRMAAAHAAALAEAQVDPARQRANALLAAGQAAIARRSSEEIQEVERQFTELTATLRQEFTLRIAGRPEDETGVARQNARFPQGRGFYIIVDAVDARNQAVRIPVRNEETNQTETVARFGVRVPDQTWNAVRADKQRNGIVQNNRLGEKRRGHLDIEYRIPVLEGRITRW
jgi:hypothetical protein